MIYNKDAEQAVIGTILLEGLLFDSLLVTPDHFYDSGLSRIFNAMHRVAEKEQAIDVITVTTEVGDPIQAVGGVSYLTELAQSIPSTESLKNYEHLVLEAYRKRKTREITLRYAENPEDNSLVRLI